MHISFVMHFFPITLLHYTLSSAAAQSFVVFQIHFFAYCYCSTGARSFHFSNLCFCTNTFAFYLFQSLNWFFYNKIRWYFINFNLVSHRKLCKINAAVTFSCYFLFLNSLSCISLSLYCFCRECVCALIHAHLHTPFSLSSAAQLK